MKYQLIHQENSSDCMETLKEYIVEGQKKETFIIVGKIELSGLPLGIINSVLDFLSEYDPKSRQNILKLIKLGHLILVCDEEPSKKPASGILKSWDFDGISPDSDSLKFDHYAGLLF